MVAYATRRALVVLACQKMLSVSVVRSNGALLNPQHGQGLNLEFLKQSMACSKLSAYEAGCLNDLNDFIIMQDNAPPHFHLVVWHFLSDTIPER